MQIINTAQGSDAWHIERHRCVTGTKIESAIGACFTNATYDKEGNVKNKAQWNLGGKTFEFDGDKLTHTKSGIVLKKCKDKQKTLRLELVSDNQSELEIDDYSSEAMEKGNDLEPLSVAKASKKLKVNFEECGMLQSDTLPAFKFSPDAVHLENGLVVGGYETKSKTGKKHIEYILNNEVPPEHLWQCLCPMIMDDSVKWWVFGHYDDRNHVNDLFLKKIHREDYEEVIAEARILLKEFLESVEETVNKLGGSYNG